MELKTLAPNIEAESPKKILKEVNKIAFSLNYDCHIEIWLNELITRFCDFIELDMSNDSYPYKEMVSLVNATKKRMDKYNMNYKANDLHSFLILKAG